VRGECPWRRCTPPIHHRPERGVPKSLVPAVACRNRSTALRTSGMVLLPGVRVAPAELQAEAAEQHGIVAGAQLLPV